VVVRIAGHCHRDDLGFLFVFMVPARGGTPPAWADRLRDQHLYLRGRGGGPTGRTRRLEGQRRLARARERVRGPDGRYVGKPTWWATLDARGRIANPRYAFSPNLRGSLVQPWRVA
jgi:hypothetical protein